ncbi:ribonuclease H-like domain-containing protein [Patescibacteria group bacterium]|nr:ribonuclease H-like domain-containing protein [Patescibacteria group bacterium]
MLTEVIFDIETKKLFDEIIGFNPADLGVSLVSLYKRTLNENGREIKGEMLSFWDSELPSLWAHFSNVDRIIGYNSIHFDVPALAPLCPYDLKKIPHLDIMDKLKEKTGFRVGLNAVASETLGITKTDNGINAVLYWLEHSTSSLKKLKEYCEHDVLVTKEVYDYGRTHGHLKYKDKWNTPRTITVDFSYPMDPLSQQMGLF